MNTEVSFKIAEMLKSKGFNEEGIAGVYHNSDKTRVYPKEYIKEGDYTSAPTIAQAIMWMYEKHGVWVYSYHNGTLFIGSIQDSTGSIKGRLLGYKTPTEAVEAAIEYALTNLV